MNMKYAEIAWVTSIVVLGAYEVWALATNQTTLSRTVWSLNRSQYGPLLPLIWGLLTGHFFWSGN